MARRDLLGRVAALEAAQAPPETLVIQVTRRIVDRAEDGGMIEIGREERTIISPVLKLLTQHKRRS